VSRRSDLLERAGRPSIQTLRDPSASLRQPPGSSPQTYASRLRCTSFSVTGSPLDVGLDRPLPHVARKVFRSKAFLRFSM
jgi:hypothetical protein